MSTSRKPIFTGSGVAIVTPFTEDDIIDYPLLGEMVEFQIANSTDAIVVCGTTGESSTMSDCEHRDMIKYTVEKVNGRIPVIAGTGSNETKYAAELSVFAREAGADAILLVTPYYNKTTQKGLVRHYENIVNAAKLPALIYNVPSRTGMTVAAETYAELSKNEYIYGCKEASGDFSLAMKTAAICEKDFYIYTGNDDTITPMLALGAVGVISVLANVLPKQTSDICHSFFEGDIKRSLELQLKYLEFTNLLFCETNPIPIKAAMKLMGYKVGDLRLPLCDISDKNLALLIESMKKLNIL